MKSTKVVCTIGPSSQDETIIAKMIEKGMNLARMNLSHGSHKFHKKTAEIMRNISGVLDKYTGILLDLQGPKIRVLHAARGRGGQVRRDVGGRILPLLPDAERPRLQLVVHRRDVLRWLRTRQVPYMVDALRRGF